MSFWEFRACCDGYDAFHAAPEDSGTPAPSMDELRASIAKWG